MLSGAQFDPTQTYRYRLWRSWDPHAPRLAFILLNPSRADDRANDPTIRRCLGFAQTWGYGTIEVVNLFAFRTPDPEQLRRVPDPIGADCDRYLLAAVQQAAQTIVAWGNGGRLYGRDRAVWSQLLAAGVPTTQIACLGLTQMGQPRHPLYLKRDCQPRVYPGYERSPQTRSS